MTKSGVTPGMILRALLAVPASILPRRITRSWDEWLPTGAMTWVSGALEMAAALAIGFPGFLDYTADITLQNNKAVMQAALNSGSGSIPVPSAFNVFAPFFFITTTPLGAFVTYLMFSGLVRFANGWIGEPGGDPALTALDRWTQGTKARKSSDRSRRDREALEGRETPERLLPGSWAGLPETTFVLVASRRKEGWEEGLMIRSGEAWYRLGRSFEKTMPAGLRTVYPLTPVADVEVFRRWVAYDLPSLTERPAKAADRE